MEPCWDTEVQDWCPACQRHSAVSAAQDRAGQPFAWGRVVLLEARAVPLVPTASFFRSAMFSADAGRVQIRVQAAVC